MAVLVINGVIGTILVVTGLCTGIVELFVIGLAMLGSGIIFMKSIVRGKV